MNVQMTLGLQINYRQWLRQARILLYLCHENCLGYCYWANALTRMWSD